MWIFPNDLVSAGNGENSPDSAATQLCGYDSLPPTRLPRQGLGLKPVIFKCAAYTAQWQTQLVKIRVLFFHGDCTTRQVQQNVQ